MSIVALYSYENRKFKKLPILDLKNFNNPGAQCTVDRIVFINPKNRTLTLEEIKEIITYAEALKKKADEHKSSN